MGGLEPDGEEFFAGVVDIFVLRYRMQGNVPSFVAARLPPEAGQTETSVEIDGTILVDSRTSPTSSSPGAWALIGEGEVDLR